MALNEEIELGVFQNGVFKSMNEFRKQNLFCDATLDINGTLFPCHRLVLIAASPYFRVMFNGNFKESNSDIIPIKEIDTDIMELILCAIYTARIHISPENAYSMLKACHLLQLDEIYNTCVDRIGNNASHIHYLIETCLFAKTIGPIILYDKCIQAIADDVLHWGQTTIFQDLSFDIVNLILSKVNFSSNDDEVLALIIKWCKTNYASSKDINKLLQAPKLSSKTIGTSVMAELIVASRSSSFTNDEDYNEDLENKIRFKSDYDVNVYLSTVDVKTGARGWGTLMLNDSFDQYNLSSYQPANNSFRKICSNGTKIYCLEWDFVVRKFTFCCYEDNNKMELQTPEGLVWLDNKFDIIAMEQSIYLFYQYTGTKVWIYSCELNIWQSDVFLQTVPQYYDPSTHTYHKIRPALYPYSDWSTLASLDRILYVIGCKRTDSNSTDRFIVSLDNRSPSTRNCITFPAPFQHQNAAVCAFDGKIAISGSNHDGILHNTFSIFDITANQWQTDLKPMNIGRAKHKLIHRCSSIYAVENRSLIVNEKYDLSLNTWVEIPSLPKRVQFIDANDVTVALSTGDVIYADANSFV